MTRTTHAARIVSIAGLLLLAFALVPGAFAAKGGGTTAGKKGGGGTKSHTWYGHEKPKFSFR